VNSRGSGGCLSGVGFQEHSAVVLQVWGTQACGQREPWALLADKGFWEHSSVALQA
jgi:hypothetical protein